MEFWPFLPFFNLVACLYLVGHVLIKNPKSNLYRVLSMFLVSFCIWSFGKIFTNNPNTSKEMVKLFIKTGCFGWCSFPSFFLWFSFIFTRRRKILIRRIFYVVIFTLPAIFIYKQLTEALVVDAINKPFGWTFIWAKTIWPYLFYLYVFSFMTAGFYSIYDYGRNTENMTRKMQAKIILYTAVVALFLGSMSDVVLLQLEIYKIPPIGDVFVFILAFGLVYAITKYEFLITPATAAANIISTMADLLILLDEAGNIVDVNRETVELLKYQRSELVGRHVSKLFAQEEYNDKLFAETVMHKPVRELELMLTSRRDMKIPVIFASSPLKDELGNIAGAVCTASDITERNKRREELRKAKEELEVQAEGLKRANEGIKALYEEIEKKNRDLIRLDEIKDEFLSMVSHEIRTPLAIMKQFISIVQDQIPGKINRKQKEYLTIVHNNINRLTLIVNDLLDISKLESGKMKLNCKTTDIVKVIKDSVISFKAKAKAKHVVLESTIPSKLPHVHADLTRMAQVMTNLIGNAIKFTPEHGRITVVAGEEDGFLSVSVTDTGQGIPPEKQEQIFDRFEQLKEATVQGDSGGAGLGLSIAKKIVELHDGKIWIDSPLTSGGGSRFTFRIPLA